MIREKGKSKYDLLEQRRDELIPYIVGYDIRADVLYCIDYKATKCNSRTISKTRNLPLKSVEQALEWCKKNDDIVSLVLSEELKKAGLK